jgi:alkylation response protein AidB-like acyl-CoA dehydrogenase
MGGSRDGGHGLSLLQTCHEQRRLAYRAPATALAINMHLYWVGVAADLCRIGDTSLTWLLEEAAAGEVFAAGHGEVGNDLPGLLSTATAERVDGGYRFTGRKMFGSLSPVWTRLGIHAMDTSDPECPMVIHAFMPRDAEGYEIKQRCVPPAATTRSSKGRSCQTGTSDGRFRPACSIRSSGRSSPGRT